MSKRMKIIIAVGVVIVLLAVGVFVGTQLAKPEGSPLPMGVDNEQVDETETPTVTAGVNAPVPLKESELVFEGITREMRLTPEQVVERFGQPLRAEGDPEPFIGKGLSYYYDGVTYYFRAWSKSNDEYELASIHVESRQNQMPRDIQVGDSFQSVLNKFPQERDYTQNAGGYFYGTWEGPGAVNYGSVVYNDGERKTIAVVGETPYGGYMFVEFRNDIVVGVGIYFYDATKPD